MIALTPDRGRVPVATEKEVVAEFEAFDLYFMLEADDGASLMATGEGFGPYALESFPALKTGSHRKAVEELKRSEVLAAMLAYFRNDSNWRESHAWVEVEDLKPTWAGRILNRFIS
jgi:hypothetical protein